MKYLVNFLRFLFKKASHLIEKHPEGEPTQFCQYGIDLHAEEVSLLILLMRGWISFFWRELKVICVQCILTPRSNILTVGHKKTENIGVYAKCARSVHRILP